MFNTDPNGSTDGNFKQASAGFQQALSAAAC